jgi:DNA-binding Lrp family transcriptional regulator
MVNAIVLIMVERGEVGNIAEALMNFKGITEVFSVAGQWDLVALLRTQTNEEIAELVTSKIRSVPGITRTETLMAFQVFSKYDLERMFAIGAER